MNGNTEHDRTPNGNTVLHVATLFGHLKGVEVILEKCPDLLYQVNSKCETALHIAARRGCRGKKIVKALIDCAKEVVDPESAGGTNNAGGLYRMLRVVNEDGDTALHLAAGQFFGEKLVRLLTKEDPRFEHPTNNAQETPLYLACETADSSVVFAILENCRSPAYSGPGGKTVLHAAATNPFIGASLGEMIKTLLCKWPNLGQEPNEYGWTPLHYAARVDNVEVISELLEHDRSMAYIRANNDDNNTALHIAAAQGFTKVMEKILSYCSDCWEVTNGKGQNIFHIAAKMKKNTSLKFLKSKTWSKYLLNQKDNEGNTPLHLLAPWMAKRIPLLPLDLVTFGDWQAFNHKNLTPLDMVMTKWPSKSKRQNGGILKDLIGSYSSTATNYPKKKGALHITGWRNVVKTDRENTNKLTEKEKMNEEAGITAQVERFRKMADPHLIVAALIATVTFAAAFTLPGGYDSSEGKNRGTAILLKKVAFKMFIIADTIAVATATTSVFLHVAASLYDDKDDLLSCYRKAFYLILIAIVAMVLAFVAGVYVVLAPSLSLAIAACVIGSLCFLIFYRELIKMDFFSNLWFLMTRELFGLILFLVTCLAYFLTYFLTCFLDYCIVPVVKFVKGCRS